MYPPSADPPTHQIAPGFREEIDRLRALYFSRDPACWPVFGDPVFSEIVKHRQRRLPPAAGVQAYPGGGDLLRELRTRDRVPPAAKDPRDGVDTVLVFAGAPSKHWEDPASVENG